MRLGYKLMSEESGPRDLIAQAVRAEEVGFEFAAIAYCAAGGGGPRCVEVSVCWAPSAEAALSTLHRYARWALFDWSVFPSSRRRARSPPPRRA
jgi:hypothetical protein